MLFSLHQVGFMFLFFIVKFNMNNESNGENEGRRRELIRFVFVCQKKVINNNDLLCCSSIFLFLTVQYIISVAAVMALGHYNNQ